MCSDFVFNFSVWCPEGCISPELKFDMLIDHFAVVCLLTWNLNCSEAGGSTFTFLVVVLYLDTFHQ